MQDGAERVASGGVVEDAGLSAQNGHSNGRAGGSVTRDRDGSSGSARYLPRNLEIELLLAVDVIDREQRNGEPLIITESLRNVVGSGNEVMLTPVLEVRLDPKMVATSPGTIPPPAKLAPFTTPPVLISGPAPVAVTLMLTTEYSVLLSAEPKLADAWAEPAATAMPVTVTVMAAPGASEAVVQVAEVGGEGRLAQDPLEMETPVI